MGLTILLIDDAQTWYDTLSQIFLDEGHNIVWVTNRTHARRELKSGRQVDIAMVNLNLIPNSPVLDGSGYLMLEELEREWPRIPRIALSSFGSSGSMTEADRVVELYCRYKVKHVGIKGGQDFAGRLVHAVHAITATLDFQSINPNVEPNSMLDPETAREIEELVRQSELEQALDRLLNTGQRHSEVILLFRRLNDIYRKQRRNMVLGQEVDVECTKIAEAVLQLVNCTGGNNA